MKLLVLGAAGGTGRQLVQQAIAQGHQVTAWTHHPPHPPFPPTTHVITADIHHTARLAQAVAIQDAVIDTLGNRRPFLRTNLESAAARALVDAMQRFHVPRLIAISSLGVGDSIVNVPFVFRLLIPLFFRGAMPDKAAMESVIRSSSLDWLIVRPSGLTNRPPTGNVRLITPQSRHHARQISRVDVAAFILSQLSTPTLHQQTVGITTT